MVYITLPVKVADDINGSLRTISSCDHGVNTDACHSASSPDSRLACAACGIYINNRLDARLRSRLGCEPNMLC
ncbi:hypothetical protein D3C71_2089610 [compost metagenome]